jgi:hypothetical protein
VYTPGIASNYLSTPDASALDITGDIDLRALVALDNWTSAATQRIVSKYDTTTNQRSYTLFVTSGVIGLLWSNNGTAFNSTFSTIAPTVTDGTQLWIRATLDVDNGAAGNDVKFFTSTNGTTWTQLGTTVTTAGVTSIYSGTAPVEIGSRNVGTTEPLAGKVYRAQILNGIDGTTVLDVDTSVITTGAATSFTAVTGQTVTINRSTSGRKTVAVTQPTWLFGTDDYMEVNNRYMTHSTAAENYVYLSGASGNYMSTGDNPPLDVTGDLDLQVKVALDDWTPSAANGLISKMNTSQASYDLFVGTDGKLCYNWSANGTAITYKYSTVATGITDGTTKWVRATHDVDNGASGNDVKFFTSDDGITWTQLGSTITTAGTTSIYSGTSTINIGSTFNGIYSIAKGKFFRAIIKNGIDGTTVLDADASVITLPSQTTFVDRSSNAYTVTINKSGVGTFVSTGNYMYLPGIASNFASAPDSAALQITGDIDLRCKVALDDWTPSANNDLIGRYSGTNAYLLTVRTTGFLRFIWVDSGGTTITKESTVATGITDGTTKWIRVILDVDNGASGNDVKFYTSDDGITWTQLGTTVTTAGTTSIRAGATNLEIGSNLNGTSNAARGKFFRAQVLNGIGGTVAFDANFENSITSLLQTSFTESSTNGATVTINRSGSGFRSAGVIDAGYLYPGATNTFGNSTISYLDFGASDSLTILAVFRQWATQSSGRIFNKRSSSAYSSGQLGYELFNNSATEVGGYLSDGTNISYTPYTRTQTLGALATYAVSGNRSTNTAVAYYNNSVSSTANISSIGNMTNVFPVSIGRWGGQASNYADMEFMGAAVFRTALTAKNISDINNYFQGRD